MDMPLERRTELLNSIVDVLLKQGAADLSLRPLAEQVGTSARLLIYHFGSKEHLIDAALAKVRLDISASLAASAIERRPESLHSLMMMVWNWAIEEPNQRYFRLLFEVDGLSMFNRISFSQEVRDANSEVWIGMINKAARRLSDGGGVFSEHATLIIGAFSGLLQEFLTTGDRETTTAAFGRLLGLISAPAASRRRAQGSTT